MSTRVRLVCYLRRGLLLAGDRDRQLATAPTRCAGAPVTCSFCDGASAQPRSYIFQKLPNNIILLGVSHFETVLKIHIEYPYKAQVVISIKIT